MKAPQRSKAISEKKLELYEKSSHYRSALTSDIKDLKFDLERWGRSFLVIGGSLYAAYKVYKLIRGSGDEEVQVEPPAHAVVRPKESSVIVAKIKEQIALFLLAIALKKLKDFLNEKRDD
ncbi:MAG: hypothetical protein OER04_05015 [Cyclobacteriaceae bacterium]|nr:hypothetical protein [Cyclobacteriaceae bacterium]